MADDVPAIEPNEAIRDLKRRQRMAVRWGDVPAIQKPEDGQPCNQCGLCCLYKPCWISRAVFGEDHSECPALQWTAQGAVCGLMVDPVQFLPKRAKKRGAARVSEAVRFLLGVGIGCCVGKDAKASWAAQPGRRDAALRVLDL